MAFLDLLNQNQKRKPLTSSTAPSTGGAAAGSSASALISKSSQLPVVIPTSPQGATIAATATSTTTSKTAPLATSLKSGGAKPAAKPSPIANQAPTAYDGTASTTESAVLQDKVPAALDPERGALTYQLVSGVAAGRLAFNANGSYSFNPGTDFKHLVAGETNRVTFSYQAIDNKGALSAPRTVTITIKGQNDALTPSIGLTPTGTYMGNRNPGDAALDLEFRVRADDMIHLLRLLRPDNTLWGGDPGHRCERQPVHHLRYAPLQQLRQQPGQCRGGSALWHRR